MTTITSTDPASVLRREMTASQCAGCRDGRECGACRKLRQQILRLAAAGCTPAQIGLRTGVRIGRVARILANEAERADAVQSTPAFAELCTRDRRRVIRGVAIPNRPVRELVEHWLGEHPGVSANRLFLAAGLEYSQARRLLGAIPSTQSSRPARPTVILALGAPIVIAVGRKPVLLRDAADGEPLHATATEQWRCCHLGFEVSAAAGSPVMRRHAARHAGVIGVEHAERLARAMGLDPHEIPGL